MKRSRTLRVHGYSKLDIVANQINEKLDHKTERLRQLIDKNTEILASIDKTLQRNTQSLEDHMKRTTQLENRVVPIEEAFKNLSGFVTTVKTVTTWGAAVLAFATGILKLMGKI